MCFNISLLSPISWELLSYDSVYDDDIPSGPIYSSSAFSSPLHPLRCMDRSDSYILSRWGLVPHWVKDAEQALSLRRSCYNARGETIFSKPAFRSAAKASRCLVPVTGFFEFREVSGAKYPYHVRMKDLRTFHLGGLYQDTAYLSDRPERTFSVVTTDANRLMSFVHNTKKRMPLIVPSSRTEEWMDVRSGPEELRDVIVPYPVDDLEAYPVTRDLMRRGGPKDPADAVKRVHYSELDQSTLDDIP